MAPQRAQLEPRDLLSLEQFVQVASFSYPIGVYNRAADFGRNSWRR
jgi:hypothetical protein